MQGASMQADKVVPSSDNRLKFLDSDESKETVMEELTPGPIALIKVFNGEYIAVPKELPDPITCLEDMEKESLKDEDILIAAYPKTGELHACIVYFNVCKHVEGRLSKVMWVVLGVLLVNSLGSQHLITILLIVLCNEIFTVSFNCRGANQNIKFYSK